MSRRFELPPWARSRDEFTRYTALKARQRTGEYLLREDFLFIRGIDQRKNALARMGMRAKCRREVPTFYGYNTAKG